MKAQIKDDAKTKEVIETLSWMNNVRDGWHLKRKIKSGKLVMENEEVRR